MITTVILLHTWFWYCILNASFSANSLPDPGPVFGVVAAAGFGHWYELDPWIAIYYYFYIN